jgi:hypothetical protein
MVASLHVSSSKSLTDIDLSPIRTTSVANKTIEGEQMTICFHVDDRKPSHRKRPRCLHRVLRQKYENYSEINQRTRGAEVRSTSILGMALDYTVRMKRRNEKNAQRHRDNFL